MHRRLLTVLLLWLVSMCACAGGVPERPRFRYLEPSQGLPNTEIKALVRDRDGYLWIGTSDGLARHDGVDMRVWRHVPEDPASLPGNNVQALLVDASDRIWVALEGAGVGVLDTQRQHFTWYRKATHPQLASDDVWAMAQQAGTVWLGTFDGGLTRIDPDGQLRRYSHAVDGLPSDIILSLAVDAQGALWVGTSAGLARLHNGKFEPVALPGADTAPMVYGLSKQRDGLWAGTSLGVWRNTGNGWQQPDWSPMFERPNALITITTGTRGDHWIGSQRGLWHQQGRLPPVPVHAGGPDVPHAINTLLMEDNDALWAPVVGRGLGYLRSDWRQMARLKGSEDGLQGGMYRALGPALDGGVWLAGLDGVVEHMDVQGQLAPLADAALERLRKLKPAAVAEDGGGRLWLAHRGGLTRIGADGAIDAWGPDDKDAPVPAGLITHLQRAADGSLWLAAPGAGVQQRDPASGRLLLDLAAGDASGLGDADIEALVLSPEGPPWLAGSKGVLRFDPPSRRFLPVPEMGSERVFALAFDGKDVLWLQRLSGLQQYRRMHGQWRQVARIGSSAGVPAVAAAALLVDARHRVWMTSSRGLFRWDPRRHNLRQIGAQDENSNEEYLDRAALLQANGVLMAATADGGVHLVDTHMADPLPRRAVLRIDGVAVRRGGHWQVLPAAAVHALGQSDREIRIRARLLAFDDPAGNRYWSKLEGFDQDWVALGGSGERVFTGLPPGNYRLRMRGRDAAGNVAQEQTLSFAVQPPWWRSRWAWAAYVLLGMALLGVSAWLYRQRLKRLHVWQLAEQRRELAEQASEAKSRFLATLGHEVRTPMTGVLGMSELLQKSRLEPRQRKHVDAIRRAGEHLLRLVNDALDLARIEAGKLELVSADFPLRPLLDEVAGLMAPVAERKGLAYVESIAADVPSMLQGDRTRVQQILLNLIGNAVKFTDNGHVCVETFALQPQGVRFVVADSGPGLNLAQKERLFRRFEQADGARTASRYGGSGLGLAISQELAAAMGGRIDVESTPGHGTRFIVDLPLASVDTAGGSMQSAGVPLDTHADTLQLLLVEDDPIVAEVMLGLLQAQGHQVIHAPHGLAALTAACSQPFDAALLDLDLPGMDGLALAQALRAQDFHAPLLAVTARSDGDAEQQARAAGFSGFLRKPVTGVMLAEALTTILQAPIRRRQD